MAMAKCRECGKEVSNQAKTCPNCGVSRPVRKSVGPVGIVLVSLFGLLVFRCATLTETAASASPSKQTGATSQSVAAAVQPAPPEPPKNENWRFQTDEDKMTGKPVRIAYVESLNSLSLDFPYKGENHGTLVVRHHPKHGLDVVVQVKKGQMLCDISDGCTVQVRFDDKPPVNFGAVGPSDHSTTSLFLRDPKRFISQAAKAKQIRVGFSMYQAGTQVVEFWTPEGLDWR